PTSAPASSTASSTEASATPSATPDRERQQRIRDALGRAGLDAVVCALPKNVLLLSGYWPVIGSAVAVATRDGGIGVVAPADELELARTGRATEMLSFSAGSLDDLRTAASAVAEPLAACLRALGVRTGRLGYEAGEAVQQSSYAAMHLYGGSMHDVLMRAAPGAHAVAADAMLASLRAVLSAREQIVLAAACDAAAAMFLAAPRIIRRGARETEVGAAFRAEFARGVHGPGRADAFVYCMAGAHAARAGAAYARSRADGVLASGTTTLVHCNSCLDGFWTDVTRTYVVGAPDSRLRAMYQAIFRARDAVLAALRPGARAADADRAARSVLADEGFGWGFTHSTGHGVGYTAIDHDAMPRLHPRSADVLEPGMVFNVEPAIYQDGVSGIRHCDVVLLEESGPRVLTAFQQSPDALIIPEI
ncbi:MAG: M24 family metallopeptidase, partial [Gemmatimonadaceae bacterium]